MLAAILPAILPAIGKVLDRVIPDPAQRDRAQAELLRAQQAGEFKELDARMAAIVMEAKSADPWTSRARPSFLYVMYVMILGAIPMGFLFWLNPEGARQVIEGVRLWLEAIPKEMWALFGAGYLGYVTNRTADKARHLGADPGKGLLSRLFG